MKNPLKYSKQKQSVWDLPSTEEEFLQLARNRSENLETTGTKNTEQQEPNIYEVRFVKQPKKK